MKEKSKRSSFVGFTLVELVIVIAVIAILAAVLIPTFGSVISSANNSADLQLVTNMNELLAINLDEDIAASVDNIRKYLGDNGINDIATKNKDMVIAYNKDSNKFERINVSKTLDGTELVTIASADEPDGRFEAAPYTMEEIFKGNVIVSTRGNDLAEAIYALHNISSSETDKAAYITKQMKKLSGYEGVAEKVADVINKTLFIDDKGEPMQFSLSGSDGNWSVATDGTASPDRVVFNEDCTTVYLDKLGSYSNLTFVLSDNVENIGFTSSDMDTVLGQLQSDNNTFAGNVEVLQNIIEEAVSNLDESEQDKYDSLMWGGTLDELKKAAEEGLVNQANQDVFYVSAQPAGKKYYYQTVTTAIVEAQRAANYSHKEKKVILTDEKTTVSGELTIPQNVTLSVPLYKGGSDDEPEYYTGAVDGTTADSVSKASTSIVDDDRLGTTGHKKFTLTIDEGAKLTVLGELEVGSVISYPDQSYQGHTSGYYGQVDNNGDITVESGGVIDAWGYIKGDGAITVNAGASVYEPFIVTDYTGGSNTLRLYMIGQSPFLRYAMLNIQNNLIVNYGALLYAHCNLHIGAGYMKTDEVVIGYGEKTSQTKGLITLESGYAECEYEYDASKKVEDTVSGNNLKGDIGKTTVTIHGNARTEALSLLGLASTKNVLFPIPFNFDFVIDNGSNMNIFNHYVLLPGSSVKVNEGGKLTVKADSTLYVMDYLYQEAVLDGNKKYPTTKQLNGGKYDTAGQLIVNGDFVVENSARVGGVIRTEQEGATIDIGDKADVSGKFDIGGVACSSANTSSYKFPLRVFDVASIDKGIKDEYTNEDNSTIILSNIPAGSHYESATADKTTLKETTDVSFLVKTNEPSGDAIYVNNIYYKTEHKGDLFVTFEATAGFKQDEKETQAQATEFESHNYSAASATDFIKAEEAINAYYQLSPGAKLLLDSFKIAEYESSKVQTLFKGYKDYAAAFGGAGSQKIEEVLAVTNARNKLGAASKYVLALLGTIPSDLDNKDTDTILFSVSYDTDSEVEYPTSIEALGDIQLSDYTIEDKDTNTTTVYFTQKMAPEPFELKGTKNNIEGEVTLGTIDPAGTLFKEVWNKYVGYNDFFNSGKIVKLDNADVDFVLYTDVALWMTDSYTLADLSATTYPQYNHFRGSNAQNGSDKIGVFYQKLFVDYGQKVELDLNGNTVLFKTNAQGLNSSLYQGFIDNHNELIIKNGTFDVENVKVKQTADDTLPGGTVNGEADNADIYIINSNGTLNASNLVIKTYSQKNGRKINMSGINSYYQNRVVFTQEPESIGNATIDRVNIVGNRGTGIQINGGTAKITDSNISGNVGLKIVNSKQEARAGADDEKANYSNDVTITTNTMFSCSMSAITVGESVTDGSKPFKLTIAKSNLVTLSEKGIAMKLDASKAKIEASISDSALAGPGTVLNASGSGSDKNVVLDISGCTLTGDSSVAKDKGAAVYGIKLDSYAEVTVTDSTIVASGDSSHSGTAVYVGSNCSVDLTFDEAAYGNDRGNWFSASGDADSKLFDINGGTVTMNKGPFSEDANLPKATELRGGYACRRLRSGK